MYPPLPFRLDCQNLLPLTPFTPFLFECENNYLGSPAVCLNDSRGVYQRPVGFPPHRRRWFSFINLRHCNTTYSKLSNKFFKSFYLFSSGTFSPIFPTGLQDSFHAFEHAVAKSDLLHRRSRMSL